MELVFCNTRDRVADPFVRDLCVEFNLPMKGQVCAIVCGMPTVQ